MVEVRIVGSALESAFIDHMVAGCIFMKPSDLLPLKIDSIPIQTAPGTLDLHDMKVSSVAGGRPLKKDRHLAPILKVKPEMRRNLVLNIENDAVRHGLAASGKSDPRCIDADLHRSEDFGPDGEVVATPIQKASATGLAAVEKPSRLGLVADSGNAVASHLPTHAPPLADFSGEYPTADFARELAVGKPRTATGQLQVSRLRLGKQGLRMSRLDNERLLHQNMPAGFQRRHGVGEMQKRRRCHDGNLRAQAGKREQFINRIEHACFREGRPEFCAGLFRGICHRDGWQWGDQPGCFRMKMGNRAGTCDENSGNHARKFGRGFTPIPD